MTPALIEYLKAWFLKADHDIISAERLIEIEPMILDSACFHCQQAIEEYLKAFLIYNGKEVAKTHDIDYLLQECSCFDPVFNSVDPANMNDYAVQGRYPDYSLMPEPGEAKSYYQMALHIKSLVLERIVFS